MLLYYLVFFKSMEFYIYLFKIIFFQSILTLIRLAKASDSHVATCTVTLPTELTAKDSCFVTGDFTGALADVVGGGQTAITVSV